MGPDLRLSAICSPGLLFNGNEDSVFFSEMAAPQQLRM